MRCTERSRSVILQSTFTLAPKSNLLLKLASNVFKFRNERDGLLDDGKTRPDKL